jgi:uncharacterized protein YbjT (DUF2867 family)
MDVVIVGGHGQIARLLTRQLVAEGHRVRGLIRNPDHAADLEHDGATPVVFDLETDDDAALDAAVAGTDAVVFAAGAGPGSGAERKSTVDHLGAVRLIHAAQRNGIDRYVMVSAMGTDDPPQDDAVFSVYLRAKAEADRALSESGLVRPGRLTDDPPTGRVQLARRVDRAEVSRADVAAVLAAVLADPATAEHTFEVVGGDTPIDEALRVLVG